MEYLKADRVFFQENSFLPKFGQKRPKWSHGPQNRVFWIFWKMLSFVFLGSNLKGKLIFLLIFQHKPHIWQNSVSSYGPKCCQSIKLQGSLKCNISGKKWKFQYFWRLIYKPVDHLWCSFYCENSRHLNTFTIKLYHRCSLGF